MNSQVLGDRYEVQRQLGRNYGRRTLLARDLHSSELVVVKLLSFGSDFEWDELKMFEREAQTLKALSHPAIPRYLDYIELDTQSSKGFALIQTYVEGKSLQEYLKAGHTFSQQEVQEIASLLLKILIYLHGRQPPVIHRDIKPSNILLTNRSGNSVGEVYLVDFGSVQTLAATEGGTITVVGTYGYMPQEQFGGRIVPASDLYSLGATLIALVTGTHPADLPQKDFRIQFEHVTNLSPTFSKWLRWMTEPILARRISSAQDALQALEHPSGFVVASGEGGAYFRAVSPTQTDIVLKNVSQPFGSKILLLLNAKSLEILLPPKGFSPDIVGLTLFAIAWNSFIVMWTTSAVFLAPLGINLFFALFSLPFWGAGIGMVWQIISTLFGRVRLRLDQQQISRTYELFGFRSNRPLPAPIQDITKLELEYLGDAKRNIIIWAGTQKYELGGYSHITEPELDWLACELSDWLKIPIQVKRLPA